MNEIRGGLPPRNSRGTQSKSGRVSFKRVIQGGLILFGALFFGLIGYELYYAQVGGKHTVSNNFVDAETNPVGETAAQAEQQPPEQSVEDTPQTAGKASDQEPAPNAPDVIVPATTTATEPAAPVTSAEPAADPKDQAAPAEIAAVQPKTVKHVVVKGDTLFKLSRQYYGNNSGVSRIASYNGLAADAQLNIGTVVTIPLSK